MDGGQRHLPQECERISPPRGEGRHLSGRQEASDGQEEPLPGLQSPWGGVQAVCVHASGSDIQSVCGGRRAKS